MNFRDCKMKRKGRQETRRPCCLCSRRPSVNGSFAVSVPEAGRRNGPARKKKRERQGMAGCLSSWVWGAKRKSDQSGKGLHKASAFYAGKFAFAGWSEKWYNIKNKEKYNPAEVDKRWWMVYKFAPIYYA